MSTDQESRPNKHIVARVGLAFGVGALGTAGAVTAGKVLLDAGSRQKAAAIEEQQPEGVAPSSAEALSKQGIIIPDFTAVPATAITTATAEPSPTTKPPESTPTLTPPKPTATSTATATAPAEAKVDASCYILPESFCSRAELVEMITPIGKTARWIGFSMPAGEPIPMLIGGQAAPAVINKDVIFYRGNRIVQFDPNNPGREYIWTGAIGFNDNRMLTLNKNVGETTGHTTDANIDMAGSNVILQIEDTGSDGYAVSNLEELQRIVPSVSAKPIRKAPPLTKEEAAKKGGTININTFYNTPPASSASTSLK